MASSNPKPQLNNLTSSQICSLVYHDIFLYPLSLEELKKWQTGKRVTLTKKPKVKYKTPYFYISSAHTLTAKKQNTISSKNKVKLATKAAQLLSKLPTIKMVGITGSLAMNNAPKAADIDILTITSQGTLWSSRLVTFILLRLFGYPLRRAGDKNEKDKLCLNLWLDESDLNISPKNIYTAHELAQIVPLVDKGFSHKRLLSDNTWITNYWPNAVSPAPSTTFKLTQIEKLFAVVLQVFNPLAFLLQRLYMKPKLTRETVTKTRAMFHPYDWGDTVLTTLAKKGIMLE